MNVGNGDLTIDNLRLKEGDQGFTIVSDASCPKTVTNSNSEEVLIAFTPTELYIEKSDFLIVESDDSDESYIEILIRGKGAITDDPSYAVQQILNHINQSVENGSLWGDGSGNSSDGRLKALTNMIESAGDLIDEGNANQACDQLETIYVKVDGDNKPPDFIGGEEGAVSGLRCALLEVAEDLSCTFVDAIDNSECEG